MAEPQFTLLQIGTVVPVGGCVLECALAFPGVLVKHSHYAPPLEPFL